jgi:hypothetical protein
VRLIWHEALDEVVVRIQALLNVCRERRVGCELGWCRRIEGPVIPQCNCVAIGAHPDTAFADSFIEQVARINWS